MNKTIYLLNYYHLKYSLINQLVQLLKLMKATQSNKNTSPQKYELEELKQNVTSNGDKIAQVTASVARLYQRIVPLQSFIQQFSGTIKQEQQSNQQLLKLNEENIGATSSALQYLDTLNDHFQSHTNRDHRTIRRTIERIQDLCDELATKTDNHTNSLENLSKKIETSNGEVIAILKNEITSLDEKGQQIGKGIQTMITENKKTEDARSKQQDGRMTQLTSKIDSFINALNKTFVKNQENEEKQAQQILSLKNKITLLEQKVNSMNDKLKEVQAK